MNKFVALRIVNLLLLCSFVVQTLTVINIYFKIKSPFRHQIFEVHEYNGLLMIVLVLTHITLNWGWIRANFLTRRNSLKTK